MNAEEAIVFLNKFSKMLDCTNPPKDLGEAIGFNTTDHSFVDVYIGAGDSETGFVFTFLLYAQYGTNEIDEEVWLNPDNSVVMKYYKELLK